MDHGRYGRSDAVYHVPPSGGGGSHRSRWRGSQGLVAVAVIAVCGFMQAGCSTAMPLHRNPKVPPLPKAEALEHIRNWLKQDELSSVCVFTKSGFRMSAVSVDELGFDYTTVTVVPDGLASENGRYVGRKYRYDPAPETGHIAFQDVTGMELELVEDGPGHWRTGNVYLLDATRRRLCRFTVRTDKKYRDADTNVLNVLPAVCDNFN